MSRTRIISPRVEPPLDRRVQWFYASGATEIFTGAAKPAAIAWCLPAQVDGTTSGPVHSLEPPEPPPAGRNVLVRYRGYWHEGYRSGSEWWVCPLTQETPFRVAPDAWRPLDDEPWDAIGPAVVETIRAYREYDRLDGAPKAHNALMRALSDLAKDVVVPPGDAELLEAARRVVDTYAAPHGVRLDAMDALSRLVKRRSSP